MAAAALKKAISYGADEAILLTDRAFAGSDTLATSYVLAAAIRKVAAREPVDIVLCGKMAIDGDTGQVGPGIATRLGYEQLTYVVRIESVDFEGRVVGVRTGRGDGEVYADVVIVAAGVNTLNSLYSGAAAGRRGIQTDQVALAVKEVIALPAEKIEERFCLPRGQGAAIELIGDGCRGLTGTAFIYTNRDSVSIGVGAMLSDMARAGVRPYDNTTGASPASSSTRRRCSPLTRRPSTTRWARC